MGLDGIELLMAIEDRFSIVIDDEEAGRATTVGDLHRLVVSKLTPRGTGTCLSSHVFYGFRRGLREIVGCRRAQVSPGASLANLVPLEGRRRAWGSLARHLGWRLPTLRLPAALEWGMAAGCLAAIPAAVSIAQLEIVSPPVAWALGLGAIPALWASYRFTSPLAARLPRGLDTVGGAVQEILALNFAAVAAESRSWSEDEVWQAVQATVVEQLGCRPQDVTRGARFVDDLGLG